MTDASRLATRVGQLEFANPILPASGAFGSGKEYADFLDIGKLGGVVTKSVTLKPTRGNPPPRVAETPAGMLNAIGLQNEGVEVFLAELLPPLREKARRVVVNLAGKCADDYVRLVGRLAAAPIDALEINISCPNVKEGGIAFGVTAGAAGDLVRQLRPAAAGMPLWVKLTPNVSDIAAIARAVEEAGADALVVANTFLGMAVDIERRRPVLANITGGLSGPAIHPLTLRLVWQTRQAVSCPIVAAGGVAGVGEVVAFLLAGASAVEVGAMNFVEPGICGRLVDELDAWLERRGETAAGIIGTLKT
ncbi:MAG: dihydroorotate dehydrogenase [Planctomycetota bacterium]|jgi:dihydroorotate dehydrogenase (NAD+) catalytic subunit|nr:dihydroorotate dehydrogenase [Planctomycetota bacterium]